ncbi:MAG: ribonuclease HII [Kiloniellales bacterium]
MPDFAHETAIAQRFGNPVVGLDEVGRAPLAGPVLAAAVWIDPPRLPQRLAGRLDDSKKLPRAAREEMAAEIHGLAESGAAAVGLGEASVEEIDSVNILAASLLAMSRALAALEAVAGFKAAAALVDGNRLPQLLCPGETVIGGDGRSLSIAAASIVAKVARDRLMCELAGLHPGYGWERNCGYPTPDHKAALIRLGPTPLHRRSFRPVREILTLSI